MKNDGAFREQIATLLTWDSAHATFDAAVKDFPPELRGKRPNGAERTGWELLEHLRIAQIDLLESCRNPRHVSPEFPAGYWPRTPEPPNNRAWEESANAFRADLTKLVCLAKDESVDLTAPIDDNRTILRAILLAADHTSYHLGQMVLVRRLLGAWNG